VTAARHLSKRQWNTVPLDGSVPNEELRNSSSIPWLALSRVKEQAPCEVRQRSPRTLHSGPLAFSPALS